MRDIKPGAVKHVVGDAGRGGEHWSRQRVRRAMGETPICEIERIQAAVRSSDRLGETDDGGSVPSYLRASLDTLIDVLDDSDSRQRLAIQRRLALLDGVSSVDEVTIVRSTDIVRRGHVRVMDALAWFTEAFCTSLRPQRVPFIVTRYISRLNDVLPSTWLPRLWQRAQHLVTDTAIVRCDSLPVAVQVLDWHLRSVAPVVLRHRGFVESAADLERLSPIGSARDLRAACALVDRLQLNHLQFSLELMQRAVSSPDRSDGESAAIAATAVIDTQTEHPKLFGPAALLDGLDRLLHELKRPVLALFDGQRKDPRRVTQPQNAAISQLLAIRRAAPEKGNGFNYALRNALGAIAKAKQANG